MTNIILTTPEELRAIVSETVSQSLAGFTQPRNEPDNLTPDVAVEVLERHGFLISKARLYKRYPDRFFSFYLFALQLCLLSFTLRLTVPVQNLRLLEQHPQLPLLFLKKLPVLQSLFHGCFPFRLLQCLLLL